MPGEGIVLVGSVGRSRAGSAAVDANGATLEPDTVIAMTRLTMLSQADAWLEGIRVDPRVRGMEVATDLQVAELQWVEAHRASVVRYLANELNAGSLRLGARHGLNEVGRWRSRVRTDGSNAASTPAHVTVADPEPLTRATASDWAWLSADPTFAAGHGLYEYRDWAFQELTEDRFRRHAERGEAFVATGMQPGSGALLILGRASLDGASLAGRHQRVGLLVGHTEAALQLLAPLGYPSVRLPDPLPARLAGLDEALAAAGLEPWPHAAVIVERRMDAADPLPAVNPERLVLEDTPRAIAKPRALD